MITSLLRRYLSRAASRRSVGTAVEEGSMSDPSGSDSDTPITGAAGPKAVPLEPQRAAALFLGACRDARKAWYATNVLARCNPQTLVAARDTLMVGDEAAIVALMATMTGPSATPDLRNAFGPAAHRHVETASIVVRLIVRHELAGRTAGGWLDMDKVKQAMVAWIESGTGGDGSCGGVSGSLAAIAALLSAGTSPRDIASGARARLALLSPFAISTETLLVVSRLSQSFVDVMLRTRQATVVNKVAADSWMRAHPDFARATNALP